METKLDAEAGAKARTVALVYVLFDETEELLHPCVDEVAAERVVAAERALDAQAASLAAAVQVHLGAFDRDNPRSENKEIEPFREAAPQRAKGQPLAEFKAAIAAWRRRRQAHESIRHQPHVAWIAARAKAHALAVEGLGMTQDEFNALARRPKVEYRIQTVALVA